jgi:hypothetical protein
MAHGFDILLDQYRQSIKVYTIQQVLQEFLANNGRPTDELDPVVNRCEAAMVAREIDLKNFVKRVAA